MKTLLRELIWLIGILLLSLLINWIVVGNSARDIDMHDTYILGNGQISQPSFMTNFVSIFIAVLFAIYLARVSYNGFKENTLPTITPNRCYLGLSYLFIMFMIVL